MNSYLITEDEWLQICGLLTLNREYLKKQMEIDEIIKQKFPFLDGYFSDESWESLSLTDIREKWLKNELINMKIISNIKSKKEKKKK